MLVFPENADPSFLWRSTQNPLRGAQIIGRLRSKFVSEFTDTLQLLALIQLWSPTPNPALTIFLFYHGVLCGERPFNLARHLLSSNFCNAYGFSVTRRVRPRIDPMPSGCRTQSCSSSNCMSSAAQMSGRRVCDYLRTKVIRKELKNPRS